MHPARSSDLAERRESLVLLSQAHFDSPSSWRVYVDGGIVEKGLPMATV